LPLLIVWIETIVCWCRMVTNRRAVDWPSTAWKMRTCHCACLTSSCQSSTTLRWRVSLASHLDHCWRVASR